MMKHNADKIPKKPFTDFAALIAKTQSTPSVVPINVMTVTHVIGALTKVIT